MAKYFKAETNKLPIAYKCGEKIVFKITAKENCCDTEQKYVRWTLEGDDGKKSSGRASCPFTVETTLDRPGFVHLVCNAYNENNDRLPDVDELQAGAGAELEKIPYCSTLPKDFDEFWSDIEGAVANHDTFAIKKEPYDGTPPKGCEGYLCYDMEISTPFGNNATGYLTMPNDGKKHPLMVTFCGYGIYSPMPAYTKGFIQLQIGAHGLPNNLTRFDHFSKYHTLDGYGLKEEENQDPKTSYWYGVMMRDLCAAKYAKSLPEWNGKVMKVDGGSQGAFQATTVAAHDKDVTLLEIFVPWFCNLKAEENGYLASCRAKYAKGLDYYDTVAQASRVKCPVNITAYLGDYVCSPMTVTALYNTFKSEKQLTFVQSGTHGYRPPESEGYTLIANTAAVDENGNIKPGKYRHYKGNEYEVLYTARDSETNEERVVYRALYGEGEIWCRPKNMWCEYVIADGKQKRRFEYIGE